jgi:hypothetical protein
VRKFSAPSDLIVCHREQHVRRWGRRQALDAVLAARLRVPVLTLEGFSAAEQTRLSDTVRTLLFWLGAVLLLAGFFWVQVGIQQQARGLSQDFLVVLSITVEFVLLAVWQRWLR